MKKTAIVYSFNTKKTSKAARQIQEAFGKSADIQLVNTEDVTPEEFLAFDNLICGAATWFDGELPNHWDEFVPAIEDMDLSGKTIALFGLGNQKDYPENFIDAIGILAEIFEAQGARLVGYTSTEGFDYRTSRAERGEQFCGLGLDYDTRGFKNKERIRNWVEKLKLELK